jgi:hypothetical protein
MPDPPRRFVYVDDGVPQTTTDLLRAACEERGVAFHPVYPLVFDFAPEHQLVPGDLLYRPAVSLIAQRVAQFLYAPGVSTFYRDRDGIYFGVLNPTLAYQRAGLSIPRSIHCGTTNRKLLRTFVEHLGGFPIVVKVHGYSRGIGVMRVDSYPTLFSVLDFMTQQGKQPLLASFIPDATHWRVVVVGDEVVGAYRNRQERDDFRTYASDEPEDYTLDLPEGMAELAIGAVRAGRVEFGGVDILEHPSGRLYLLESNCPCYFGSAQTEGGFDVAGKMLDHLLLKAERLERTTTAVPAQV